MKSKLSILVVAIMLFSNVYAQRRNMVPNANFNQNDLSDWVIYDDYFSSTMNIVDGKLVLTSGGHSFKVWIHCPFVLDSADCLNLRFKAKATVEADFEAYVGDTYGTLDEWISKDLTATTTEKQFTLKAEKVPVDGYSRGWLEFRVDNLPYGATFSIDDIVMTIENNDWNGKLSQNGNLNFFNSEAIPFLYWTYNAGSSQSWTFTGDLADRTGTVTINGTGASDYSCFTHWMYWYKEYYSKDVKAIIDMESDFDAIGANLIVNPDAHASNQTVGFDITAGRHTYELTLPQSVVADTGADTYLDINLGSNFPGDGSTMKFYNFYIIEDIELESISIDTFTYNDTLWLDIWAWPTNADNNVSLEIISGEGTLGQNNQGEWFIKVKNKKTAVVKATSLINSEYTANITIENISRDASLSALSTSVGILSPAFNESTLEYLVVLPLSPPSLDIMAESSSEFATIVGDSTITSDNIPITVDIIVTAEDEETTQTYSLTITGPIVYYPFDETTGSLVHDFSGNDFNGAANCENCWSKAGKFDGTFHFQDIHKIDLPAGDIDMNSEEGTITFWSLLPESSASDYNCIWWTGVMGDELFGCTYKMHVHTESSAQPEWNGGEVSFYEVDTFCIISYIHSDPLKGSYGNSPSGSGLSLADSVWHHLAFSWGNGRKMKLYIDGEPIDSVSYSTIGWYFNYISLGLPNTSLEDGLKGYLDEFRLYNFALNDDGIKELYEYAPIDYSETDATLSDLKVDGETITGFSPTTYWYPYLVDESITTPPTVTATKNDENASNPVIDAASTIPDTTIISVTAADGESVLEYRVYFYYNSTPGTDATLSDLKVDGITIPGFSPTIYWYDYLVKTSVSMPPIVTATKNDEFANNPIIEAATTIPDTTIVTVTAEDGETVLKYYIVFDYVNGINVVSFPQLIFYPNPAQNNINLNNKSLFDKLEVYSIEGEKLIVKTGLRSQSKVEIGIEMLSSGFYFIRAYDGNKPVAVGKFIKEY